MDKKTLYLGSFPDSARKIGRYYSPLAVKVEIEISTKLSGDDKPRLSIVGEVGYSGARDCESCGQIQDTVRELLESPGAHLNYPPDKIARLLEIWERWHLNDMRAGCEHQRATWDPLEKIELVTYKLKSDVLVARHQLEQAALKTLRTGISAAYNRTEGQLVNLPYEVTVGAEENTQGEFIARNLQHYEVAKRETKTAGWVYPTEHPRGLLCKPCPTCGYKYGSAWLYEPLPADVVTFLEDF